LTEARSTSLAWITGAGGLIGHHLVQTAPRGAPTWRVRGLTRAELDLLDFEAVRRAFRAQAPALILHCAALSRTPDCQAQPQLARRLNVDATALLAELAAEGLMVFLSTDLVFDGRKGDYRETDAVNPLSVYGETKAAAETIVLANPRHMVVRTSLNLGVSPTGDRAINEQMRRAWARGETLRLFTDEFRCPIPAAVTARAVWELVAGQQTGLFHVAGRERLSRYDLGRQLAARWPRLAPRFAAASAAEHAGPPRPRDVSLNCAKVQSRLSFQLPGLSDWLRDHPEEPL
jgi:dTDP-4-dehydrorhamnose reductase